MPIALITGASAGLGRALARSLAQDGWQLVIDARHADRLSEAAGELRAGGGVVHAIPGDVADPRHRAELAGAARDVGRLDLLVHNASTLGPTPLPSLASVTAEQFLQVVAVNAAAPLALMVEMLPMLPAGSTVLSITSDAAVEHYPGWGLYGAAKASLEHLTLTWAAENPGIACYTVDPGDMRTAMQQDAFPGEDITDRPAPESVVPGIRHLLRERPASGRYRAADWSTVLPSTDGTSR